MVRQNPVLNPQGTSPASEPELASWLTRDLRPKGAPLSTRPAVAALPPSEAEVLAGWLTQDLTPKHSLRPRGSVPPSERLSQPPPAPVPTPAAAARPSLPFPAAPFPVSPFRDVRASELPASEAWALSPEAERVAAVAAPTSAPAPVDSLAPQAVTPEPPSLPILAPASLDDDDLAVLPGRRRAVGSDRKRYAFVLLGALCFAAVIGVGVRQRGGSDGDVARGAASPTDVSAVLPPPPPSADELSAAPAQPPAPRAPRAGAPAVEPDDGLDPLDPRNAVGGPSVRRYADVPSPTLSRLAREQRRLARERDEAMRKEKAAKATPR